MKAPPLISAVESVLQQGCTLLSTLDNAAYAYKEDGPYGASLGAHYRHVLDHFSCLLDGIGSGQINYDHRPRNPELENSVGAARSATENLIDKFLSLSLDALQGDCTVIYSVDYDNGDAQAVRSNVAREVMFCVGHAIHHYAILKLLCLGRSVALPYKFGIAPSTLKHIETHAH